MEELIVRIENAMRPGNASVVPENKDIINIGNCNFNLARQVLTCNAEERKLSYKESELLKYFTKNRDKLIDRREILNLLWGNDNFFNSRNLDVYIAKLRGYLKMIHRLKYLQLRALDTGL